jgi:hypothetical protein
MRLLQWLARLLGISAPPGARPVRARGASRASPANENGDGAALPEVDLSQPSPAHDWGDTAALGEDQGLRFGFVSCQVPTPVAFGGPEVEDAVREHGALVQAHLPAVEFAVRRSVELPAEFNFMDDWCVQLFSRGGSAPPLIHCCRRASAAHGYRRFFGLARQLVIKPRCFEGMYLLVHARGLVSLTALRLRREPLANGKERCALEADRPAIVVEPLRQHSVRQGDEWVVGWRVTREGPLHVSRTPAAPPTDTPAQLVDAMFAEYRDELLADAWAERARNGGSLEQSWPVVLFNRLSGESAMVGSAQIGRTLEMVTRYPRVRAVLDAPWPRGWLPVLVDGIRYAGLRWIPLRADAGAGARPEDVTELPRRPVLYAVE